MRTRTHEMGMYHSRDVSGTGAHVSGPLRHSTVLYTDQRRPTPGDLRTLHVSSMQLESHYLIQCPTFQNEQSEARRRNVIPKVIPRVVKAGLLTSGVFPRGILRLPVLPSLVHWLTTGRPSRHSDPVSRTRVSPGP